jgi:hypothetical protein
MIRMVAPESAVTKRGNSPNEVYLNDYLGDSGKHQRGPQGFLVDIKTPGHVIKPHFHRVDQFQIVVGGGGTLGKHRLKPVTVHYTDGFTPYGPIVAGADGLLFFNLRSRGDVGAHYMPGEKDNLERKAGRNLVAETRAGRPEKQGSQRVRSLIEGYEDGLAVYEIVAGPNTGLLPDVAGGGGRYELVLNGGLVTDGRELGPNSLVFASAGERLPERRAGAQGVHLLEVQAPAG